MMTLNLFFQIQVVTSEEKNGVMGNELLTRKEVMRTETGF